MDDKRDEIRDWLGRIDPMGGLVSPDGKPRKVKHVLPLARLAVFQTIALALILAVTVVAILALVMAKRPATGKQDGAVSPMPSANIVPPPKGIPAFSIGSEAIPTPDADAGELPEKLVAWRFNSGAEHAYGPVVFSNFMFIFAGDNGNIYGLHPNGEVVWSARFPDENLQGLLPAADGVLAYGLRQAQVYDYRGNLKHTIKFNTALRGEAQYDRSKSQLLTCSYNITGQDGRGIEQPRVTAYNLDGTTAWEWDAPNMVYWAVPGKGSTYVLVGSGRHELNGTFNDSTELYRLETGKVSWHKDFGIENKGEVLEKRDLLYISGTHDKHPALLEVSPASGKIVRSTRTERWATDAVQIDDMYWNAYVPGPNMVEVVGSGQQLFKAGTDVDHANAFEIHSGSLVVVRDYDIMMYDHTGCAGAKVPLGKDLGNKSKGGVAHYENGILATFGGELVCFDFMTNSAEMARYVRH
jgi:hypothetical protein